VNRLFPQKFGEKKDDNLRQNRTMNCAATGAATGDVAGTVGKFVILVRDPNKSFAASKLGIC
jgi:hypothetical protein